MNHEFHDRRKIKRHHKRFNDKAKFHIEQKGNREKGHIKDVHPHPRAIKEGSSTRDPGKAWKKEDWPMPTPRTAMCA